MPRQRQNPRPSATAILVALSILCSHAQAKEHRFSPDQTLTYKSLGKTELKLDVFKPKNHQLSDSRPAIVFFFGGGWTGGSPRQFYQQARHYADRGMVAIAADYRVKSRQQTTPFESVKDGKSAIRWVRQHAAELGIDPDRIVASGGSAGGHVAACTGVIQGLDEQGEDLSISSVPNAMILFNPVLDTTAKGYGLSKVGKARQTDISPCHHVRAGIVPTLVLHGTADTAVPFENATRFVQLMKKAGNNGRLAAFTDKGHGFFNAPFFRPKIKDASIYERAMKECDTFLSSLGYLDLNAEAK
jgi:acetyl esterase/lipase